ncbi:MAG TPA: tripartite tricarboxylate transporter substrate binding protein [Burkholderiales bacterium]|nr:tripartite tricarboxylate transporter substrate binding protein [Burkholderiales bacterium]
MRLTSVIASMLVATAVGAADRQPTYPLRPIRVIVPQGPGSTTDLLGRIVFTRMSDRLGKQLVVDNRPGAGGTLGMDLASHAAPDGYTIAGVAASMLTIGPHIYRKLPYDPLRDFVPIGLFVTAQTALCVNANLPARSVREFVDLAKSRPAQLNMSSAGVGSTSHLGGIMFATLAGITPNHVPYKGGGPSVAAVAQGEAQWTVPPLSAAMPQVRAGRMRCLATGGDRRSPVTPELPTIAESGVAGFRYYGWNGVIAPRGTPRPVITHLNRVMGEVLTSAEVKKLYFELGEEPVHGSPEDFGKLIREDYERMGKLVKVAGIKPE